MGGRERAKLPSGGRIRAMANEKLAHIKNLIWGSAEGRGIRRDQMDLDEESDMGVQEWVGGL